MVYPTPGITNYYMAARCNSPFSVLPFINLHKHTTELTTTSFLKAPWFLAWATPFRGSESYTGQKPREYGWHWVGGGSQTCKLPVWEQKTYIFYTNSIEPLPESGSLWSHVLPRRRGTQKEREGLIVPSSAMKAERRNQGNSSYCLSEGVRNTDRESKPYEFFKIL